MPIMKLVTAIIKPQQVDNVKEDLNKLGIHGLTSTDVKGFGRQKGHTEFYRGSEFEVAFLPKTKLKNKFGYDDSLDVFGIHGVGGTVGAILTGIFAKEAIGGAAGLLEGNTGQLWLQFIGVAFTIVYTGVLTFVILKIVNLITPLRATPEEETQGLDLNQHGEQVS